MTHSLDDGTMFPFMSSTDLHPEWPVAALDHVDQSVSVEVQNALLALQDHKLAVTWNENLRCDTTPEIANLASQASASGSFTGFRTARSYFGVRTTLEEIGILGNTGSKGELRCVTGDDLYASVCK